jgi:hypothetical protein
MTDNQIRMPLAFAQLAGDVRLIARTLNDYLRESGVDVTGSPAAVEFAQQSDYADETIAMPVLHVLVRDQYSLCASADHLLGLAACIEAEDVVFASMSLLRPIVTALGTAGYLLDPKVSLRERL